MSAANNVGRIDFETPANSARMSIDSAGNVGIGTTNPSESLQVLGNIKANAFNATGTLSQYYTGGGISIVGNSTASY